MTRRFRLSLFICLAAAVGLHVRPCIVTLLHGGAPSPMDCGVVLQFAGQAPESSGSPESLRSGIPLLTVRPALAAMLAEPALVGMRTAVAGGR